MVSGDLSFPLRSNFIFAVYSKTYMMMSAVSCSAADGSVYGRDLEVDQNCFYQGLNLSYILGVDSQGSSIASPSFEVNSCDCTGASSASAVSALIM